MNNFFNKDDIKYINDLSSFISKSFPNKRKSKYSVIYYIKYIYYVLKTGIPWSALICDSHYTSIYKKFIYWTNLNVFGHFYETLNTSYIKNIKDYNFFIDASHIKNIRGSDCIRYNHYDRNINSTKLHVITDSNNIPIAYDFTK